MLQELRIGPYSVNFWSNGNDALEPIHVHISEGKASPNATKSGLQAQENAALIIQDADDFVKRITGKY